MRRLRRIAFVFGAIVILIVAYRVLGVYEFRTGECAARPPRKFASTYPARLTVMSYNIQGHATFIDGDHVDEIAAVINKYKPDVVGLNEAHRWTWQARFGDHVKRLRQLTGMNIVFGRSYQFMGGQFGNAVLTRGVILKSEVHELPGTGEPRTLLESIVRVNGGTIDFYVTHTAAWAGINKIPRGLQLRCINNHVRASSHPFIVTGDLNAPPEASEVSEFLNENVLILAGNPKESTHKVMGQRLDYVLADGGWKVKSARVIDDGPSDHRPVLAELIHP